MVSVKAGLPFADVKKHLPDFPLPEGLGEKCPKSGDELRLRMGKNGLFVACAGYPDCDFTVDIPEPEEDAVDASELEGQTCEECGSPMKLRTGRDGSSFLGCTAYPNCRSTVAVKVANGKAEARPDRPTGEKCPALRARPRDQARPLRRLRRLHELPRLPLPAGRSRSPRRPSPARSAGRARSSSARGASGRSTAARTTPPARRTSARAPCRRPARRARPPTSS